MLATLSKYCKGCTLPFVVNHSAPISYQTPVNYSGLYAHDLAVTDSSRPHVILDSLAARDIGSKALGPTFILDVPGNDSKSSDQLDIVSCFIL